MSVPSGRRSSLCLPPLPCRPAEEPHLRSPCASRGRWLLNCCLNSGATGEMKTDLEPVARLAVKKT